MESRARIGAGKPTSDVETLSLPISGSAPRSVTRGSLPAGKRLFDLVVGGLLLIACTPLLFVAAVLVRLTSRGPFIYRQLRIGLGGEAFTILKIRTMVHDAERASGPVWAAPGDGRSTAVGRVLRRFRADEIPQLWNVMRGEMSLVGPRPERPEFVERFGREIESYRRRMEVRPGLTGLAQVSTGYDASVADVRRKLAYDLDYIDRQSLWLDLVILCRTVGRVLGGHGI